MLRASTSRLPTWLASQLGRLHTLRLGLGACITDCSLEVLSGCEGVRHHLRTLDLSFGTFGSAGLRAVAKCEALCALRSDPTSIHIQPASQLAITWPCSDCRLGCRLIASGCGCGCGGCAQDHAARSTIRWRWRSYCVHAAAPFDWAGTAGACAGGYTVGGNAACTGRRVGIIIIGIVIDNLCHIVIVGRTASRCGLHAGAGSTRAVAEPLAPRRRRRRRRAAAAAAEGPRGAAAGAVWAGCAALPAGRARGDGGQLRRRAATALPAPQLLGRGGVAGIS
jgi:hypothetical protein